MPQLESSFVRIDSFYVRRESFERLKYLVELDSVVEGLDKVTRSFLLDILMHGKSSYELKNNV